MIIEVIMSNSLLCRAGYVLNLYWMQAILNGVLRALSRSKPSKTA